MISRWTRLRMRNVSVKFVDEIKAHIFCSIIFHEKSRCLWGNAGSLRSHVWRHNAAQKRCCLHAGQLRQEYTYTDTHSKHLLLGQYDSGCASSPQCYVVRTLPAFCYICKSSSCVLKCTGSVYSVIVRTFNYLCVPGVITTRIAQFSSKENVVQVVCLHTRLSVNGVLKHCRNKGDP